MLQINLKFLQLTCKLFASTSAFCAVNLGPKATVIRRSFSLCFLPVRCRESLFLLSSHFRRIYSILKRIKRDSRATLLAWDDFRPNFGARSSVDDFICRQNVGMLRFDDVLDDRQRIRCLINMLRHFAEKKKR